METLLSRTDGVKLLTPCPPPMVISCDAHIWPLWAPDWLKSQNLGDILGAHHDGNFQTQVSEIKAGIGVLKRGTVLATGTAGDIGKLVLLTAGTEAQSYGVLLDPAIDTADAFGDGSVTGSVAKAGSFRGPALIVPAGVDAGLISVALRGRGIFVEGPITPGATALEAEAEGEPPAECEAFGESGLGQSILSGRRGDPRWRRTCPCGQVGSRSRSRSPPIAPQRAPPSRLQRENRARKPSKG